MEAILPNGHISEVELTRLAVLKGLFPRYLYKYRGTDEFTKNIIKNNALWFSTPLSFNDPFDCQITLDTVSSYAEIKTFLRLNNPKMKKGEIQKQALEWHKKPHLLHKTVNDAARITFNKNGVCCFTTDHENILMWSHYADAHKGICMKFDVLADPKAFFALFQVEYKKEYPKWNHLRELASDTVAKLLKTKAKVWEYEKEYRVLKYSDSGNHSFAPLALVEIIFGCRASEAFIHDIQQLTQSPRMSHVVFKKVTVQKNNFGLDIKDLS